MIVRIFTALIPLCVYVSMGQSAFPSAGEMRVSEKSTADLGVATAVNNDGQTWVVWASASQWFTPELAFDGGNNPRIHGGLFPASLPGNRWAMLTWRDSSFFWSGPGWEGGYRYAVYLQQSLVDSTPYLFGSGYWSSYVEHDEFWESDVLSTGSNSRGARCWIAVGDMSQGTSVGISQGSIACELIMLDFTASAKIKRFDVNSYSRVLRLVSDWFDPRMCGYPLATVSSALGGSFFLINRRFVENESAPRPSRQTRALRTYSLTADTLSADVVLDSLQGSETNMSDRVLPGKAGEVLIVRHPADRDAVIAERFRTDGVKLATVDLVEHVRCRNPYDTVAQRLDWDYHMVRLDDGRYALAWSCSESGGSTDVYAALFDADLRMIASPKRLNGDTTGEQHSPFLAVQNDSLRAAWLDARNGSWHVYLRCFVADALTSAPALPAPLAHGLTNVFPNPACDAVTVRYALSEDDARSRPELELYDALGRSVGHVECRSTAPGEHSEQLDTRGLPAGMYTAVLRVGGELSRKRVFIVR
jgi:hypothetical protein